MQIEMAVLHFLLVTIVSVAAAQVFVPTSGKTIRSKIMDEERFVVFNSRRLTGECCKYSWEYMLTLENGALFKQLSNLLVLASHLVSTHLR
jgi:hypothetical protein